MDEIFEIIFEFVVEIVVEGFLNLYKAFLPSKVVSPIAYKVIKMVALIISATLFVLLIIGIGLLIESGATSVLGWVFVSLYGLYLVLAIVAWVFSAVRKL